MNTIVEKALEKIPDRERFGLVGEAIVGEEPVAQSSRGKLSKDIFARINFERLKAAGIFRPEETDALIRDEFRRIKRPLLKNAFGKSASLLDRGNLIVITSAVPSEGKTFTAVNLALSISEERDRTVLLIDADVTKSEVTRLFELEGRPGLTNVLKDESVSVGDVLVRTDVPQLALLPAGPRDSQYAELVASNRMEQIISEIAQRYADRIVIFDAPPILATSESQMLVELAGQTAFVVLAGKTPQYLVKEALSIVNKNKAVNLILNQALHKHSGDYYYYNEYR